ncbi:FAD-dependent oxidoreductase [Microbacterium sp. NRRL B-14842]|uniref:FAD-dependent oxidoreductase n=1 Tax=Microbacterium sp. NRRL B-14842 TaxID=3162881 RepID=UPI003D277570
MSRVVIVGASVGGLKTAQALRSEGFEGEIVLIDQERHPTYDKPPLSKKYLTGETARHEIELLSEHETRGIGAISIFGTPAGIPQPRRPGCDARGRYSRLIRHTRDRHRVTRPSLSVG